MPFPGCPTKVPNATSLFNNKMKMLDAKGEEDVMSYRGGSVLGKKTILKSDHFPGCQNKRLSPQIDGAPNYRQAGSLPVHGVAIPTVDGIRNVLDHIGAQKNGKQAQMLWHNLREEPVVYINGRPFVLRDVERPFSNLEYTVILFSDILTPLPGMNIPFDIVKGKGPIIYNPLRTTADVDQVREFVPEASVPYVGQALRILRQEVHNEAAVLGFVGAPFTLASYVVEGGSSKNFSKIKTLAFSEPKVLHALLQKFAASMAKYIQYQADNGAQAVQIFDSWATELSPVDFEEFSLPYLKQIVGTVKRTHPDLPLILYASGSGGLLERLPLTGVDVVSLDWTVDMADGRRRLGSNVAVQGNVDPGALFGSKEFITKRILDTVKKAGSSKHILNLGHGIKVGTPEENVAHFFEVAKGIRY